MIKFSIEKIKRNSIPILSMIMFAFFPTSFAGKIGGNLYMIVLWSLVALFELFVIFTNAVNIDKLRLVLFTLLYMVGVSAIQLCTNEWARLSIARIAPMMLLLLSMAITIKYISDFSVMEKLIDFFLVICIIWNTGILLQLSPVVKFTEFFYSQYYENALYYSMLYRKPVMSFGVHTYAAFYYFLMFLCNYGLAKRRGKKKDYICCLIYIMFTVFLTSNSSLIYAVIMLVMYLFLLRKKVHILLGMFFGGFLLLWQNSDLILQNYAAFLTDGKSGFRGRYIGNNSFGENLEVIKNSLGIGFCILDDKNLVYTDSGYIMYLTMGGIVLAAILYFLLVLFVKDNIPKAYRLFILFLIMSFEVAVPGTFNYRFIFALIFAVYFFKALDNHVQVNSFKDCKRME